MEDMWVPEPAKRIHRIPHGCAHVFSKECIGTASECLPRSKFGDVVHDMRHSGSSQTRWVGGH
eukprot:3970387-Amphidinium_carterae.1